LLTNLYIILIYQHKI